jgi:isoleucyl-tRNA synthetase
MEDREEYRAKGKSKTKSDQRAARRVPRFRTKWIGVQREQFQALGAMGDWMRPYTTMAVRGRAQIVRELHKFVMNGLLYRGSRPGDVGRRSRRPRSPKPRSSITRKARRRSM